MKGIGKMKPNFSLKELNANGLLVLSCKKHLFVQDNVAYCYVDNRASTCYVHYYKHAYIVTQYILSVIQMEFNDFQDAQRMFNNFVESIQD